MWRDQLRIAIAPDRLLAVRISGTIRRQILDKQDISVSTQGNDWRTALSALTDLLKQPAWQKADAVVILSNRFAVYQLLPWSGTALSAEEQLARARHVYAQSHGETADALELRISEGDLGEASLAAGVERELLASLREGFKASSVRLVSVQPYLMSAFNGFRNKLGRGALWFAVLEPGMMCLALLDRGGWQSLRVKQTSDNWFDDLQLMLRREQVTNGLAEQVRRLAICLLDGQKVEFSAADGWSLERLQLSPMHGFSPETDGHLGMALAGLC
ncbi:hypothetical protein [Noviherbaspirillum massiliense]|uniref:hypothetical protein n=1 Tax=Noviherbaspirillum massiliense TaxID=1465823 RepID=UPI000367FA25|nr:hypothetical protein [Noviherbaspirillum massiliense]